MFPTVKFLYIGFFHEIVEMALEHLESTIAVISRGFVTKSLILIERRIVFRTAFPRLFNVMLKFGTVTCPVDYFDEHVLTLKLNAQL